ncbi:helicase HerA domain-containing protein [Microscilla marina]|uniref:Helicase HerA central domain-containing protein n=1 Tax=Microscilla marina ATCC 23134 TaxID=313606 RepID=A1ZJW7_MICM2|nr:DUF87 domain-containing protein [Microscilla marina]EAY29420.1 conserved hypothetical protein [Microscilla marina ATCC 23134]
MPFFLIIAWLKKIVGIPSTPKALGIPLTALKKHTYITGRSGSGKSELMKVLFYTLQKQSHKNHQYSLLLLDPHGDLAEEMFSFQLNGQKEGGRERVLYIDPYMESGYTPVINPLELPNNIKNPEERDAMIDLLSQELAGIFQEMIVGSTLSLQMEALLVPCIAVLLRK